MPDFNWFKSALIMILTMRTDDAKKWDPLELVGLAKSFHVDALGFSAGGIMAFYPTQIDKHPRSPWLSGKDLVGETVEALHRGGLRAIGRIDPSLASNDLFLKHPDWFTVDANNCPITVHDSFVTCPNGNYYYQFIPDVIKEILDNYEFDGLWANAARFAAWHSKQCFCPICQSKFKKLSGHPIPSENWGDPVWRHYNEWRYRVLILPNMACMAKKTAKTIAEYVKSGGLLITTYKTGLFDEIGKERNDFLLAPVINASYSGSTLKDIRLAYGYIRDHDHPVCRSFENTELIPLVGDLCLVSADACRNSHPVTFITSIEGKGGSGISVPEFNKIERHHITDLPLMIENKFGCGHSIFFPFQPDKAAYEYGLPDMFRLLGNAVRMAAGWKDRVEVQGAGLLDISVTGDENRMVIHISNFSSPGSFNSGQRRPMQQIVPIRDLKMTVRLPRNKTCNGVKLVFNKARVTPVIKDGKLPINIPELNELESVVLSLK